MDEMSKRNRFWNQCLWMAVFCAALAKPANSDIEIAGNLSHQMPFFEVATTLLHGQVIQLVVSWDGSKDQGRFVDLTIRSNEISRSCPEISCQRLGIDAQSGVRMLPEVLHYMEEPRECEFYPGCNYKIIFQYEDNAEEVQQDVIIPNCVDNLCRCDYQHKFPNFSAILNYEESIETLHFHWSIDESVDHEFELKNFVIRYFKVHNTKSLHPQETFEPHLVPSNGLLSEPWSGVEDLLLPRIYFGTDGDDSDLLKVEVFLIDSRNCQSNSSVEYLELKRQTNHSVRNSQWMQTSLIVVIVAGLLVFVTVLIYKTSKLGQHIMAKLFRWPMNYSNINIAHNSMTRTSFAMQENRIYVEKELYEAKVNGEVDSYEISPSCLSFGPEIGKGAFGRVFVAQALDGRGNSMIVAVKRLKHRPTEEEADEFFNEIKTMKSVGYHENIISLLGCCTLRQPALIVMEYIGKGDLQKYLTALRSSHLGFSQEGVVKPETVETDSATESDSTDSDRSYILHNEKPMRPSVTETLYTTVSSQNSNGGDSNRKDPYVLDHQELQGFAIQIANGMAHLEDLEITHRDLAARNVLIDHQRRLKISDFGMSRDGVYVTTKVKKMPLRWMSTEAIRRSLYSSKSDVWAFGIVLWEIGTLGLFPYEGMDNHELLPFLLGGGRLQKPENCSKKLYEVMLSCWRENPLERPSFFRLIKILQEPEQKIYIDLDELGDNDVFYEEPVNKIKT